MPPSARPTAAAARRRRRPRRRKMTAEELRVLREIHESTTAELGRTRNELALKTAEVDGLRQQLLATARRLREVQEQHSAAGSGSGCESPDPEHLSVLAACQPGPTGEAYLRCIKQ